MSFVQPSQKVQLPDIPAWLVWLLAFFFLAYGLGAYPILDNNEGLYAEIPREMLAAGDWHNWIIPHLNGLAYMEKPPLLYWLTAFSFALFGEHEWAARLVPALSALACVGMMMWFGRQIARPNAAKLAALMFISGLGVIAMSRTLMFDMLLTAMLTGALMSGYLYSISGEKKRLYWSMTFLALALLAKGFVAIILFGIVTFAYTILLSTSLRDFFARLATWLNWRGLGLFFLIAAPWHIAAIMAEPIFAWFYFINEHVLRFLGKREPHDYYAGAWWYYLPRMLIYLFPWSFFLPLLLFVKAVQPTPRSLRSFLSCAWIIPVLFFSLSSAKANYYLVVVMPLAALQLALALEDRAMGSAWARGLVALVLAGIFAALAWWADGGKGAWLATLSIYGMGGMHFVYWCLVVMTLLSAGIGVLVWRYPRTGLLPFVALPAMILFTAIGVLQASSDWTSTLPMALELQSNKNESEVFLYRVFENQSSLPFYLKQPVRIIDSRSSDLFWGNKLHKNEIVVTDTMFDKISDEKKVSIIVLDEDLQHFNEKKYASKFINGKKIGHSTLFVN
ncbi:ArnT family glycosyltransferase [Undibacterium sp. Ji50W]|uniref:ArnT family glycosyltransferase n=1 Tax=Undibacterium sp. Ji50W TaxID=3413041 RepID=UPI003BF32BA3